MCVKRLRIVEQPADTVAQLVERMHDDQRDLVRILASVRFSFASVAFFPLCYPGEALKRQISTVFLTT